MVIKALSRIFTIAFYIEMAILVILVMFSFAPKLFGYDNYYVRTASMTPAMPVGAVAYVNDDIRGKDIAPGDVVAFYIDGTDGEICTHRAVANDNESQLITTKGDANEDIDVSPVSYGNVVGRVDITIPYMGLILAEAAANGFVIAIIVLFTAVISAGLSFVSSKSNVSQRPKENTYGYSNN